LCDFSVYLLREKWIYPAGYPQKIRIGKYFTGRVGIKKMNDRGDMPNVEVEKILSFLS
jgi:hypothetical protein